MRQCRDHMKLKDEQCLGWMELGASFVRAAAEHGRKDILEKHDRSVEGLLRFIRRAEVEGVTDSKLMATVLQGHFG